MATTEAPLVLSAPTADRPSARRALEPAVGSPLAGVVTGWHHVLRPHAPRYALVEANPS
ncbi:hypothetical protein PROP_00255 [Propionicimonas sp. T2.31MG-18]|uniref:hypothetical protein n=1 Tax=Propionicimonas sp. T2.31MG-18 TaxID=3157620 RepID=UPI0035EB9591